MCKDIQGHQSVTATKGACQSGAHEMCGCKEKSGSHAMPMRPGIHHSDNRGTCCCGEHKLLSKEERIEILEKRGIR